VVAVRIAVVSDESSPLAYGVNDAAKRIGVGRSTLYQLIRDGQLRSIRVGRRTLIPDEDLRRIIASRLAVADS
jgi:excisionase family DNA binding protein